MRVQKRKVPMRKCVASNEMFPKKELIRIVRSKEGEVSVDLTGKKSGRGAYVSRNSEVISQAQKKRLLDRHLEATVPDTVYEELLKIIARESLLNND
ncbi:MAG: RNase P modulator RnpM [Bacilli bacterium]